MPSGRGYGRVGRGLEDAAASTHVDAGLVATDPRRLVLRTRETPFPLETARDLLGIARALYVAWKEQGRPTAELEQIGKDLRAAIALARKSPVPSVGNSAAWAKAERATERLGVIVGVGTTLQPIVGAMERRLLHSAAAPVSKSEQRKRGPRR
jgi:hypothetical protein